MTTPTNYETKTAAMATGAKEFLTIVIGVALGYAIAVRGPDIPGLKTGSETIFCNEVGALVVYVLYASRFYFNNWLYLSEAYDNKLLESMNLNAPDNIETACRTLRRSYIDLAFSIYSAIIISITSIFGLSASADLNQDQWHHIAQWLMGCLIAHYLVDFGVLFVNSIFIDGNTTLNKVRSSLWIFNHLAFIFLSAICFSFVQYSWLLWGWFLNCVVAMFFTTISPFTTRTLVKWKILSQESQWP